MSNTKNPEAQAKKVITEAENQQSIFGNAFGSMRHTFSSGIEALRENEVANNMIDANTRHGKTAIKKRIGKLLITKYEGLIQFAMPEQWHGIALHGAIKFFVIQALHAATCSMLAADLANDKDGVNLYGYTPAEVANLLSDCMLLASIDDGVSQLDVKEILEKLLPTEQMKELLNNLAKLGKSDG